jgi:hypothetical protein
MEKWKQQLKEWSKQNQPARPKKKKQEKVNWADMMGMNRPTYRRHKGAYRQK